MMGNSKSCLRNNWKMYLFWKRFFNIQMGLPRRIRWALLQFMGKTLPTNWAPCALFKERNKKTLAWYVCYCCILLLLLLHVAVSVTVVATVVAIVLLRGCCCCCCYCAATVVAIVHIYYCSCYCSATVVAIVLLLLLLLIYYYCCYCSPRVAVCYCCCYCSATVVAIVLLLLLLLFCYCSCYCSATVVAIITSASRLCFHLRISQKVLDRCSCGRVGLASLGIDQGPTH